MREWRREERESGKKSEIGRREGEKAKKVRGDGRVG